jgi:hypothetical protein
MSSFPIKDLAETTDLGRMAMADIRGGFISFGFGSPSSRSGSVKTNGIDGESTDDKHIKWIHVSRHIRQHI